MEHCSTQPLGESSCQWLPVSIYCLDDVSNGARLERTQEIRNAGRPDLFAVPAGTTNCDRVGPPWRTAAARRPGRSASAHRTARRNATQPARRPATRPVWTLVG